MVHHTRTLASIAALLLAAASPGHADTALSSASISDSVATSVGSISDSVHKSSNSSSKATGVAEGDYRVTEIAASPEHPDKLRMKLQSVADRGPDGEFSLDLPPAALEQHRLGVGDIVTAHRRSYGLEFADGRTRQAFFLALKDDWFRELKTSAIGL